MVMHVISPPPPQNSTNKQFKIQNIYKNIKIIFIFTLHLNNSFKQKQKIPVKYINKHTRLARLAAISPLILISQ
jgi:hypothetical protein